MRSRSSPWHRVAVMVAALLLAVIGWFWWPAVDQRVQVVSGRGRSDTQAQVQAGDRLSPGTRVVVEQPLILRWPDASTLTLTAASRALVDGDGATLEVGRVDAEVMPRTATQPFRVHTRDATVTVIGTRFSVRAEPEQTTVAVAAGTVRVTNQQGEDRTLTAGGETAATGTGWVTEPVVSVAAAPNTLTQQERAVGWILLFDGTSTVGWRGFRAPAIAPVWSVRDGSLQRDGSVSPTIVDDLATTAEFGDFDLRFDWRIGVGGNSGVLYRARTDSAQAHDTGPEYQVVDALRHPDGRTALTWPGACYALFAPPRDLAMPAGQWNRGRIVVRGAQVEHWLNDSLAVRYTLGDQDWQARVARSKFARLPRYGGEPSGRIILQDHGDAVAYRSLKLLSLTPRAP